MRAILTAVLIVLLNSAIYGQSNAKVDVYLTGSFIKFKPPESHGAFDRHHSLYVQGFGVRARIARHFTSTLEYNSLMLDEGGRRTGFYNLSNVYGELLVLSHDNFNWGLSLGGAVSDYGISQNGVLSKSIYYYLITGSGIDFRLATKWRLSFHVRNLRPIINNEQKVGLLLFFGGLMYSVN